MVKVTKVCLLLGSAWSVLNIWGEGYSQIPDVSCSNSIYAQIEPFHFSNVSELVVIVLHYV